jgi:hypothetical protein
VIDGEESIIKSIEIWIYHRLSLGTFQKSELAAHAFDALVWWLDGRSGLLNFPEVENHEEA